MPHLLDDACYVVAGVLHVWVFNTVSGELVQVPLLLFFELRAGLTRRNDECNDLRYHYEKQSNRADPCPWRDTRRGRRRR